MLPCTLQSLTIMRFHFSSSCLGNWRALVSPTYLAQGLARNCHSIQIFIEFINFIKTSSWQGSREHEKLKWIRPSRCEQGEPQRECLQRKPRLPDHGLHSADQLLRPTLPRVDGGWGGLVEVRLRGGPHLVIVVIGVASFAVPNRPVSVTTAAPCRKAGDDRPSDMGAAVLEAEKVEPIKVGFWEKNSAKNLEQMEPQGTTGSDWVSKMRGIV